MNDSYIKISNLTKRYGELVVLDNISLEIWEGEFLALLGPSGCGKTTLLKTIAGFVEFKDGDILIDSLSMKKLPPNRRPVNTVFQNYALFPHMTVRQNVAYGPQRAGKSRAETSAIVDECLSIVGMATYADRYPSQLSGGQQQRVALARALASRPKVLLLDEPLSALDLKLRKQMQMELKALQQKLGMTFIFVTHDQEEALVMADRIAVMNSGRIAQIGSGREIYDHPSERYVADFIGEANLLAGTVDGRGEINLGAFSVTAPAGIKPGSSITYLLRPEAVQIGVPTGEEAGYIRIGARVCELVFAGGFTNVFVDMDGGRKLIAQQRGGANEVDLAVGMDVILSWRRDAARILTN